MLALAGLAGTYTLAGFYLVPGLIRSQATQWVRTNLGKPITLGEIRFNPFRFTVDLSDVAIPGPTKPIVALGHLHLDFSIRSLFADAYRFDEVRLERPLVDAVIRPDGSLNLAELLPKTPSTGPSPAVRIDSLSVDRGRLLFTDLSRPLRPSKTVAPISFTLTDFQTNRAAGGAFTLRGQSERGEGLAWTGTVSMAPIASRGRFTVTDLRSDTVEQFLSEQLPAVLTGGRATIDGTYAFSYGPRGMHLDAALPRLELAGLAFNGKPALFRGTATLDRASASVGRIHIISDGAGGLTLDATMPRLALHGIGLSPAGGTSADTIRLENAALDDAKLDYGRHMVDLARLALDGANISVRRDHEGRINLMSLLPAAPAGTQVVPAPSPPWNVRLGALALDRATLHVEDRAVTPTAHFDIQPIHLSAAGLGSDLSRPMDLHFTARINGKTSISGDGLVTPASGLADLKVALAKLPLQTVLPYLPRYPGLDPRSGTMTATGTLHVQGADSAALRFKGDASLDDFVMNERATNSPLFGWRGFSFTGIDYRPTRVEIDHGHLNGPFGRIAILANRTFNYTSLETAGTPPAATPSAPAPATHRPPPPAPALPFRLKQLDISSGTMGFADYSIQPNFEAQVDALQGSITNVSNVPGTIAAIDLSGHVIDRFSPVTIKGSMDLLGYDQQTDIRLAFRNIELPVFDPYSGRYAGYAIAKGKLTTELHYRIENRALKADHHVIIDQLQWGQATESKERVPLPIRLATSLLKNKDGVIDLDIPVNGSLNDPQFRLAPILWKIVGNVIEKAATAPFRLIGSIFAGAEKAQYVDFAPGSTTLPPGASDALTTLAKALVQRPALQLDIPAGPAIKEEALEIAGARIDAALMAKEAQKGAAVNPSALKVDELHARLRDLYRARLGKKPAFPDDLAAPTTPAKGDDQDALKDRDRRKLQEADWMRAQLRNAFLPSNAELAKLGSARATAVRDALLADGGVDPARVFMATEMAETPSEGHARLELRLR